MTDNDKISQIEKRADEILKEHKAVYLERRLYNTLKNDFSDLSRVDFKEVLNLLSKKGYVLERGLIRPCINKGSKKSSKGYDGSPTGKGVADHQRIPDKRL
ncbi:hypothetical protein HYG87_02815 [Methanobacterium alkalithermotolerans]|uniref:Uncharacterized protein n=1 Tax=Methanobacterium alkalithermotolerans TaxID=2731220 RepID=A0A8T8KBL3_9EURY|nr:hypothetical protein [Methanobacterium alkalithermotolerans]QUH22781.1 hypothetical protein HYG87_02815 [Methanobacterium alkalithermotolerans]RJS49333.1 MAG: hypothetical protein CIT03_03590 [Methanobacterium sp.]